MYHSLFIHSPSEEHLSCFQVWAVMNKAAINFGCRLLCGPKFSTPSGVSKSMSKRMFSFVRNWQTVFQSGCSIL